MPQESRTKVEELQKMYQDIKSQVQISRKEEMVSLIIGDFNCKIGNEIEGNTKETSK